jgi:methionine biosynthesis protein MetW
MARPRHVLSELLRIAARAVVSLPNFGHWQVRLALMAGGRMPVTGALPDPWWSTSNIHLCTLADFVALTEDLDLKIEACAAFGGGAGARAMNPRGRLENLRAESALFVLSR